MPSHSSCLSSIIIFLLISSSFVPFAAYSPGGGGPAGYVYRCPMGGIMGSLNYMSPYGGMGGGTYCGTGSIFHYYVCCDYNPMECCLQLDWVIVALVVIGLFTLLGCLGCCAVCFIMQKK